jgi:hypothetical protein
MSSSFKRVCHPVCPCLPWNQSGPGFLLLGPHQRPPVRLSVKESRLKFANANKFDRKSWVEQWMDLLFLSVHPI